MIGVRKTIVVSLAFALGFVIVTANAAKAYYPTNQISNGGFEADPLGTGWQLSPPDSGNIGTLGTTWHGGVRGVKLGYGPMGTIDNSTDVYQDLFSNPNFFVPTSATTVTFSLWINVSTDETVPNADVFFFNILDANTTDISYCSYSLDVRQATQNTWTNVTCDISAAKGKTVHVYIDLKTNNSGTTYVNVDDVGIIANYPDVTSPTTSFSITPIDPASCTFSAPPTITLTGTDDAGGSGIASIFYTWDNGSYATYSSPIPAPLGTHVLSYYSADVAGNVSTVGTQTVVFGDTRPLAERLADANKNIVVDTKLVTRLKGRILLQVQKNGEAWYLNPKDGRRYFLCRPASAFLVMRKLGLGITNADLLKIPRYNTGDVGDPVLVKRLLGYILLQVERNGEAWYLYPVNGRRNYMGRPSDAFALMRLLGLGVTNANLNKIPIGLLE